LSNPPPFSRPLLWQQVFAVMVSLYSAWRADVVAPFFPLLFYGTWRPFEPGFFFWLDGGVGGVLSSSRRRLGPFFFAGALRPFPFSRKSNTLTPFFCPSRSFFCKARHAGRPEVFPTSPFFFFWPPCRYSVFSPPGEEGSFCQRRAADPQSFSPLAARFPPQKLLTRCERLLFFFPSRFPQRLSHRLGATEASPSPLFPLFLPRTSFPSFLSAIPRQVVQPSFLRSSRFPPLWIHPPLKNEHTFLFPFFSNSLSLRVQKRNGPDRLCPRVKYGSKKIYIPCLGWRVDLFLFSEKALSGRFFLFGERPVGCGGVVKALSPLNF